MGKGSKRRPTNEGRYGDNYDRIFGTNPRQKKAPKDRGESEGAKNET